MDGKRFDDLSRKLATPHSRRGVLGLLGAAVAGLVSAPSGRAAPPADKPSKCYGAGSNCTNAKQCCSGTCTNRRCAPEVVPGCADSTTCPGTDTECQTRTCIDGRCGMAYASPGTVVSNQVVGDCKRTVCDGNGSVTTVNDDFDLPIDGNRCTWDICTNGVPSNPPLAAGAPCGVNGTQVCDGAGGCPECLPGETIPCYSGPTGPNGEIWGICQPGIRTCLPDSSGYGECIGEVGPREETCNGLDDDCDGEIDEARSSGPLCPPLPNATSACLNGQCVVAECSPGFLDCNGDPSDGCEADTMLDANNCGGCGQVCRSGPNAAGVCEAGVCRQSCSDGFMACNSNFDDGCECPTNRMCEAGQCCSTLNQFPTSVAPCCSGLVRHPLDGRCVLA